MRALVGFLFAHRWKGQLAEAKRLLATAPPALDGLGRKLDAWLDSAGWEVRNAAVKLIAHVRDEARYPRLVEKLADRSEAGIVRRNAVETVAQLGLGTPEARAALLAALADPYWEARAAAVTALATLFPPDEGLERALLGVLYGPERRGRRAVREGNFEVRMACARALAALGGSHAAFDALLELARDDIWLVRSQAAVAIAHFAARHPDFHARAREELRGLDRLSEGAVSYFVHREILGHVLRAIHKGPQAVTPEELCSLYLSPKAGWNHVRR